MHNRVYLCSWCLVGPFTQRVIFRLRQDEEVDSNICSAPFRCIVKMVFHLLYYLCGAFNNEPHHRQPFCAVMGMCWGKQNIVYLPEALFFSYQVAASVELTLHKILTSWKESPRSVLYAVVKVIFGNCLLNNSAVCCTSLLLTIRKMSSVWFALESTVVRHGVGWKHCMLC